MNLSNLEQIVLEISQQIKDARDCYYKENWLSDKMFNLVFVEKVKQLKEAIDEAIKADVL